MQKFLNPRETVSLSICVSEFPDPEDYVCVEDNIAEILPLTFSRAHVLPGGSKHGKEFATCEFRGGRLYLTKEWKLGVLSGSWTCSERIGKGEELKGEFFEGVPSKKFRLTAETSLNFEITGTEVVGVAEKDDQPFSMSLPDVSKTQYFLVRYNNTISRLIPFGRSICYLFRELGYVE